MRGRNDHYYAGASMREHQGKGVLENLIILYYVPGNNSDSIYQRDSLRYISPAALCSDGSIRVVTTKPDRDDVTDSPAQLLRRQRQHTYEEHRSCITRKGEPNYHYSSCAESHRHRRVKPAVIIVVGSVHILNSI